LPLLKEECVQHGIRRMASVKRHCDEIGRAEHAVHQPSTSANECPQNLILSYGTLFPICKSEAPMFDLAHAHVGLAELAHHRDVSRADRLEDS
jgi:hypothetical protein